MSTTSRTKTKTLDKKMINKKYTSKELTIRYKGNDIRGFSIGGPTSPGDDDYIPHVYENNDSPSDFGYDYNYVYVLEEDKPVPRYHVIYMVRYDDEKENGENDRVVSQEWYPMNTFFLEVEEEVPIMMEG